jgi:hypothetical protein
MKRYLTIGILGALLSLASYHVGFTGGLQTGLAISLANAQSAMLGYLSVLRRMNSDDQKELVWGLFSAELIRFRSTDDIYRYAEKPLANLSSAFKGEPTIYSLVPLSETREGRLDEVINVCRLVAPPALYQKYCELLVSERE